MSWRKRAHEWKDSQKQGSAQGGGEEWNMVEEKRQKLESRRRQGRTKEDLIMRKIESLIR